MCEQCLVNPYYYGEFAPGWFLIRVTRESDMKNISKACAMAIALKG